MGTLINSRKDLGIYIHIPFCKQKCGYCDFLSFPVYDEEYILLLKKEIQDFKYKNGYIVKTIFIGGGTPSLINERFISDILDVVYNNFSMDRNTEITIECNPGTLNKNKLKTYKSSGINRLSIGLQSTDNDKLKILGRIHTFEEFFRNYKTARECGFDNINIDMMSALPNQSCKDWEQDLKNIVILEPEHISAYSLIIEEGTPFYKRYAVNDKDLPNEDDERQMYYITHDLLSKSGYERYEISNYAKKGFECRHNISYWERTDYIGFGLGASSLINERRFSNLTNINQYKENIKDGKSVAVEEEKLSLKAQMEESAFLGLRLTKGVDCHKFEKKFDRDFREVFKVPVSKYIKEELLVEQDDYIRLTDKGIDVSNYVMSDFLLD